MQNKLNRYFRHTWQSKCDEFIFSGPSLIDKVSDEEWVLDVGCGDNFFKGKIKNLVGIDPANDAADIQCTIEELDIDQKFDVAFCLGSINFGDIDNIDSQITKLITHLNPLSRIYWRLNPGLQDHGNEHCKEIDFFEWSEDNIKYFADKFGFDALVAQDSFNRLYSEWHKKF